MSDVVTWPKPQFVPRKPGIRYGSKGPAASRSSFKKLNREVRAKLATNIPEVIDALFQEAMTTEDHRMTAVFLSNILDVVLGKPRDRPPDFDDDP